MKFLVLLAAVGLAAAETKVASVGGNVSPYAPLHTHTHKPCTHTTHTSAHTCFFFKKGWGGLYRVSESRDIASALSPYELSLR